VSDALDRWLTDAEPDKASELSDEEAIAALDAKSGDPEEVDLWRTLDTMAGRSMNPPRSLADVRRSYLKARRRQ
jgi:hypothetical protein